MNSPGNNGGIVTGRAVVVVAPVVSKFSRFSPAFGAAAEGVAKLGVVFS